MSWWSRVKVELKQVVVVFIYFLFIWDEKYFASQLNESVIPRMVYRKLTELDLNNEDS